MIGETVGSYRIVRPLGEGGMGVVYLAEHTLIGRRAAVKMLQPELSAQRDMVGRFFNEARASALVKHPGIVDIYDFGYHATGAAYLVMEFLDGESLAERLRREGRLSVAAAVRITRQLAAALAVAHGQGIIHRDLKPDNVFLVRDPEVFGGDRVKLLDFGIAKLIGAAAGGARTVTGLVIGTPSYMSPEQCAGARNLDGRSDLYAVGCILFAMVSGRVPFEGETGWVVGAHQHLPPPDLRSLAPGTPVEVAAIVARLLAKAPHDRFADAGDLLLALGPVADDAAASRPPPPPAIVPRSFHVVALPTTLQGSAGAGPPQRERPRGVLVGLGVGIGLITAAVVVAVAGGSTAPTSSTSAPTRDDPTDDTAPAPVGDTNVDARATPVPGVDVDARPALVIDAATAGTDLTLIDLEPPERPEAASTADPDAELLGAMEAALAQGRYDEVRRLARRLSATAGPAHTNAAQALVGRARRADLEAAAASIRRTVRRGDCGAARTRVDAERAAWGDVGPDLDDALAGCAPTSVARQAAADDIPRSPLGTARPDDAAAPTGEPIADPAALVDLGDRAGRAGNWSLAFQQCGQALRASPSPAVELEAHDLCARAACALKASGFAARHLWYLHGQRRSLVVTWCKTHGLAFES